MARPQIMLSPEQVREVETLAALLSQDQIADYFGIGRNTFRAICNRDTEVLEHYKRGKAKAIAHVANGLLQRARAGCKTSSILYLKTQAGWRETAVVKVHEPHEPVNLDTSLLTDEALESILAAAGRQVLVNAPGLTDEAG